MNNNKLNINFSELNVELNSLKQALSLDLEKMTSHRFCLIDDFTIYARFWIEVFEDLGIKYRRIGPEELLLTSSRQSNDFTEILLFPFFGFRIFNINFNPISKTEFGQPYFVLIENNKQVHIEDYFKAQFKTVMVNPSLHFPFFFKQYFLNPTQINFLNLKKYPFIHNDQIDREIIVSELSDSSINIYSSDPNLGQASLTTWLWNKLKFKDQLKYEHYPVHRFYERYFNIHLDINLAERKRYGNDT